MEDWILEIRERAASGSPPVSSGRSRKLGIVGLDDLTIIPAQLSRRPVDYYTDGVSADTVIGPNAKKPLRLRTPILIGAMSFGALSKEAKIALAKAATAVGTAANTGEGGMLTEEREAARLLIAQYASGRFGVDETYIRKADAIEIKFGQGAKPGMGGLLPGEKVTEEIAKLRRIPVGQPVHSPAAHPDIGSVKDLRRKIRWLRNLCDGPIIVKFGAGDVETDTEFAVKAEPDAIAIDGMEGGTGAAPRLMLDDFGVPTVAALVRARRALDKLEARQQLLIGGGLSRGSDIAKALALGADAVFIGTAMLVAMGCAYCRQCHLGRCPYGIATQDPILRGKLNVDEATASVVRFVRACTEEVKMAAAAAGYRDVHELNIRCLRSLSLTASKLTGIPLA